ncbi:hypothetical protein CLV28_1247 [Sediminihabitans luteus]|uniref:N-acetyltransferase domain-containing protein n=1 Tax=Sediminihabitans luteus TaxID=1138585 RepID=A0A2M9CPE4_9CELL|nr:GNAT family N-acetyltransferase [Sediminihabitans luteus]PJJ73769.1 hypothetical protein CLV28_1247 [Sediminihabitans luteus]GIJ00538.1 GNAT family acetyltransferase [Sediminihabitans luteus]
MPCTTADLADTDTLVLRPARSEDIERIVELNNASTPAVPMTPLEDMRELVEESTLTLVAAEPTTDEPVGFVVTFDSGADFDAENYAWFEERDFDHYYVDRIVVGAEARDQGLGQRFYEEVIEIARREGRAEVTCEVNVEPVNPGSLRFHGRLGFEDQGEQLTKGGDVVVKKFALPLAHVDALQPA